MNLAALQHTPPCTVWIKACGLTNPADIDAAIAAGVDALGFVFVPSPRQVQVAQAADLLERIPRGVLRIAVYKDPSPDTVRSVTDHLPIDAHQSDSSDYEHTFDGLVPPGAFLPVVRDSQNLCERAEAHAARFPRAHRVVLAEGQRSGAGEVANWELIQDLAQQRPVVLAGGLHPGNVADAIRAAQPIGVDASSGLESSPGKKDHAKLTAFVRAARAAATAVQNTQPARPNPTP